MVTLTTNRTGRLDPGAVVYAGDRALTVVASRIHQGRHLVQFDAVSDRTEAEGLRGLVISADALPTEPDTQLDHLFPTLRGDQRESLQVICQLSATGPLTVNEVLRSFPPRRRAFVRMTIMWLAKAGTIEWLPAP